MMTFLLCYHSNLIREFKCLRKIFKFEGSFKYLYAIFINNFPALKLPIIQVNLFIGKRGHTSLTRDTFFVFKRQRLSPSILALENDIFSFNDPASNSHRFLRSQVDRIVNLLGMRDN